MRMAQTSPVATIRKMSQTTGVMEQLRLKDAEFKVPLLGSVSPDIPDTCDLPDE